ncbi:tRNA(Ile)-lysidine synthase TilS/MesJ [Clostridium cavendishii DSM 21758]|uniref:tRNA(Ile)-lysidine synthase TilS/MesJ n=1 Tax=Clostridium cavendishii DSM 21758 TaxID=1121302 RepID=A0A1M6N7G8_9CLOT|nr:hypothetical protein [Clostridium cavendishii]SHJ91643.1 tRNA(Ile)-lysidine synthase TilS/MesJ [Clostridium cavendishii DSM 21758]
MNRCIKCGLAFDYPESHSEIIDDTCLYCKDFNKKIFLGEDTLIDRLQNYEKIGVSVSGGKDSIYVWYWLVSKFGSNRVIAFNHNKGKAVDPIASENILRAQKILKSEVVVIYDSEFYPRFVKNLSTYIKNPNPAIARAVLCSGCRYGISQRIFDEAKKYDVNCIVNGSSYLEKVPFKSYHMKQYGDGSEIRGLLKGLYETDEYLSKENLEIIIRDHFYSHEINLSNQKNSANIDYINFFDYLENDIKRIKSIVTSKLDWKHPKNSDWHFDCIIEKFKNYFYLIEYGYSEVDFKYSEMVRYGLLSRDEAISLLKEDNEKMLNSFNDLVDTLVKLEVDFETIVAFKNLHNSKIELICNCN